MRKTIFALALAISFSLLLDGVAAAQFAHASGTSVVDAKGNKLQLRGINLGNWLVQEGYMFRLQQGPQSPREIEALVNNLLGPAEAEKFWHSYRDRYITKRDIDSIRRAGFNSIRIPLHYKFFMPGNDEGFVLLDRVIGWSKQAGLYVILDLHCAPGGQTGTNIDDSWGYPWLYESEPSQRQTMEVWQRIAMHYRDDPTVLGYDLLNEPIPHYPQLARLNDRLEPLYKRITTAVREVDPNHMIILGGAQWDSNFKVFGPPFDKNAMYTFHKYWTPPTQEVIQQYIDYRDKYKVPIYLGESGENTNEWIAHFTTVLEKNEIGWTFWPYKKMEATSSVTTFAKPVYWDEIVAYAKLRFTSGELEKSLAARPPQEHITKAFQNLLQKIELDNCRSNPGYTRALGLRPR